MRLRLWAGSILFFSILNSFFLCAAADDSSFKNGNFNRTIKEQDTAIYRSLEEKLRAGKLNAPVFNLQLSEEQKERLKAFKEDANFLNRSVQEKVAQRVDGMAGKKTQLKGNADMSAAKYSTLVFASLSMPESDIRELYRSLAGSKDTAIVIRGLPKGTTTLNEAIRAVQKIAIDMKLRDAPSVVMNPVWFEQYHVKVVPTIVRLESTASIQSVAPQGPESASASKEIARVEGVISPLWLNGSLRDGSRGDLGRQGPVYEIGETDIVEEMQRRASKIDWDEKKKKAYARVWKNLPFEELPKAAEDRKRLIDPAIILKQDIKGADGTVIAPRGTKVNPLNARPFTRLMVFFNGEDQKEIEFVKSHLKGWQQRLGKKSSQTYLILTELDREKGWKAYDEITEKMDARIYLLQHDMKSAFQLEASPCIAYQEGNYMAIEEFRVE